MNHPDSPAHQSERVALAILIPFVATAVLIAVGSLWPQSRLWGLGWYQFFPGYVGAIVLPAAAAIMVWRYRTTENDPAPDSNRSILLPAISITFLLLVLFVLLCTRTHFLGDGYILLGRLESGAYTFQPWEYVPFTLERWVYEIFAPLKGQILAFRLISWFSGAVFTVAVWWTAARLYNGWARRMTFALGMLTGGYLLLFFGYVEHYPLFVAVVTIFTMTGLLVAKEQCRRWWLLPSLAIGLALHPFGVVLIIPALYLLLRNTSLHHAYARLSRPVRIAIPVKAVLLAIALFVYLYVTHLFFRLAFVPLIADRFTVEGYTLFSWRHLADVFSLIIQLVPGLLIFVVLAFMLPARELLRRPESRFLAMLSLLSLAITFIFDPKIGLPRDWDLFAFAGVPLSVFAFHSLLDRDRRSAVSRLAPVAMIILSVVLIAPRVATQVSADRSIEVFQYFAGLDPIRNKDGRLRLIQYYRLQGRVDLADQVMRSEHAIHPELTLHERAMQMTRDGDIDGAIATYKRVLAIDPSMATTWSNLGLCYLFQKRFDSAVVYLEAANGVQPYNAITLHLLGQACYGAGETDKAARVWREAIRLAPDNIETYRLLLSLYREVGDFENYRELLSKVSALPNAAEDLMREAADSAAVRH